MTTIHAGDHTTDCETCQANCDCQDCRIKNNLNDYYQNSDEYTFEDFEAIFEDADPFDYL